MAGAAMSPQQELLAAHGIRLESTAPGRYYTTCPQCSDTRSRAHRKAKVLGVTIENDGTAHWGCNHCAWTGPEKGAAGGNGQHRDHFAAVYDYYDASDTLRFQKVRNLPGAKTRFFMRRPDGQGGGGWINNTKGIDTSLLYRWPQVIEAIASEHTILVVEGEKDADSLWRIGIPATCNAHGAADPAKNQQPKWKPEHSEQLRGANIVVLNDHDPPGYAHADAVGRMSLGIAKRVRRLDLAKHWPECPAGGDVSDWLAAGHTREELDALIEQAGEWTAQPSPLEQAEVNGKRFPLIPFNEVKPNSASLYRVKGLLPSYGIVIVWGPPKCGKSFWTFDLVMHIVLDWPYRGRRVKRGPCVYCAFEGQRGFPNRVEAFRREHELPNNVPFYLSPLYAKLVADHKALIASIKETLGEQKPAAIVIDTLNRSIDGSESKDEDMSKYLTAAEAIEAAFECVVIVVHHCGVDGSRPRGHTSMTGTCTAQIAVRKDETTGLAQATVEFMKEGPADAVIAFQLKPVEVGTDEDGDPQESCVVVEAAAASASSGNGALSKNQQTMFSILYDAGPHGLTLADWNKAAREAGIGTKRKADLHDYRSALKAKKLVHESNERWIAKREEGKST
jgi:hypothetical protein